MAEVLTYTLEFPGLGLTGSWQDPKDGQSVSILVGSWQCGAGQQARPVCQPIPTALRKREEGLPHYPPPVCHVASRLLVALGAAFPTAQT